MDSTAALNVLQADLDAQNSLITTYTASTKQAQDKIDAINAAMSLLKDGYQIDQARIDEDAAKVRADVAEQIATLTTEKDDAIKALDDAEALHLVAIDELNVAIAEKDAIIANLTTQINQIT